MGIFGLFILKMSNFDICIVKTEIKLCEQILVHYVTYLSISFSLPIITYTVFESSVRRTFLAEIQNKINK